MNINNDILDELKDISPLIAALEKINVFTVPAGYFETLELDILKAVKEEGLMLHHIAPLILNDVPQGYFDSLAETILNKIKAEDNAAEELESLSPVLHNLPQQNVFIVPEGYFESLATSVLDQINTVDYAAGELNESSLLLHAVKDKNVFTVPEGYFETLPIQLIQAVQPQQAKLVTMRSSTTTFIRYAIAAVFTGVMALGVYQFAGNGTSTKTALPGFYADAKKIKDVDAELAKVSDDDIIKYLQANGENIDAQTLAANITNDNELPAQEDYLTDDKALDKFLDNIDLNDLKN